MIDKHRCILASDYSPVVAEVALPYVHVTSYGFEHLGQQEVVGLYTLPHFGQTHPYW